MACPSTCPMCEMPCVEKTYPHFHAESGMQTVHQCGKHWWLRYKLKGKKKFVLGLTDFSPESRKEVRDWRRENGFQK